MTTEEEWPNRERWWIAYMREIGCNLTNHHPGGCGSSGMHEGWREAVAAANKRRTGVWKMTDEQRERIATASVGRPQNGWNGMSEDGRRRLAASKQGKPFPWADEHRANHLLGVSRKVPCPDCGVEYAASGLGPHRRLKH